MIEHIGWKAGSRKHGGRKHGGRQHGGRQHGGWILTLAALLVVPGVRALGDDARQRPAAAAAETGKVQEVKIDNFSFTPRSLRVAPGTTVTWVNRDDIPHTVVSSEGAPASATGARAGAAGSGPRAAGQAFKSKTLDTGDKFSFTFARAGTFPYFCSLHPKMTGEVVVQ
jgi:plastocyanin